jgi:hypothetical protein
MAENGGIRGGWPGPGIGPALTPLARPGVIVLGYRWRHELLVLIVLMACLTAAVSWIGPARTLIALAVLFAIAGLAATRPEARRFAAARFWCVVTPHRVRTCFAQSWINNRAGHIPAVVRATATPCGERVLVWCRAGTSFEEIASASEQLTAACWAVAVVVSRSSRFAQVVYLDVVRRPDWGQQTVAEPGPADFGSPQLWPHESPRPEWPRGLRSGTTTMTRRSHASSMSNSRKRKVDER